jgi:hypothetical protein
MAGFETADLDSGVRLHIYDAFIEVGHAPTIREAATALELPLGEVEASFHRLADSRAIVLRPGTTDIWMANPFSAVPTPFTVRIGDRSWFGSCIWDALGVVAMLGGDGEVETFCPDCKEPLALAVEEHVLRPAEAVAHFAVPAAHWWDDIGYT